MVNTVVDFQMTIFSGAVRANQSASSSASGFVTSGRMRSGGGQEYGEGVYAMDMHEGATQTYSVVAVTGMSKLAQIGGQQTILYQYVPPTEFKAKTLLHKSEQVEEQRFTTPTERGEQRDDSKQQTTDEKKSEKKTEEAIQQSDTSVEPLEVGPPETPIDPPIPPPPFVPPPDPIDPPTEFTQFPTQTTTLFTEGNDDVDFNTGSGGSPIILSEFEVNAGSEDPQSIFYDALGGNDTVTLPLAANVDLIGYDITRQFFAGAGNDTIMGNDLDDMISGGDGNDIISGGPGADVLTGDVGFDILSYADDTAGVDIDLSTNSAGDAFAPSDAAGDTIDGFEGVIGGSGLDILTGDDNANYLDGGLGSDCIIAGGGNDDIVYDAIDIDEFVNGGTGTDSLLIPSGAVFINADNFNFTGIELFDLDFESAATTLDLSLLNPADFAEVSVVEIFVDGSNDTIEFGELNTNEWVDQDFGEMEIGDDLSSYETPGYTPIFGYDLFDNSLQAVFQINDSITLNFTLP